jgi:hypothetical protein
LLGAEPPRLLQLAEHIQAGGERDAAVAKKRLDPTSRKAARVRPRSSDTIRRTSIHVDAAPGRGKT